MTSSEDHDRPHTSTPQLRLNPDSGYFSPLDQFSFSEESSVERLRVTPQSTLGCTPRDEPESPPLPWDIQRSKVYQRRLRAKSDPSQLSALKRELFKPDVQEKATQTGFKTVCVCMARQSMDQGCAAGNAVTPIAVRAGRRRFVSSIEPSYRDQLTPSQRAQVDFVARRLRQMGDEFEGCVTGTRANGGFFRFCRQVPLPHWITEPCRWVSSLFR